MRELQRLSTHVRGLVGRWLSVGVVFGILTGSSCGPPQPTAVGLDAAQSGTFALEASTGRGSAFWVGDGLVLTAGHVVGLDRSVTLRQGGTKWSADLVSVDFDRDLALLRMTSPPILATPRWATSIPAGLRVFVIGYPAPLDFGSPTVTAGIISSIRTVDGVDYLQLDAAANPGNSGGPVVTTDGALVGVVVAGIRSLQGLNFAVPASAAQSFVKAPVSRGSPPTPTSKPRRAASTAIFQMIYLPGGGGQVAAGGGGDVFFLRRSTSVWALDIHGTANQIRGSLGFGSAIAIDPDTKRLLLPSYASSGLTGALSVLEWGGGSILSVPVDRLPQSVVFESGKIFLTHNGGGPQGGALPDQLPARITVIDAQTMTVTGRLEAPGLGGLLTVDGKRQLVYATAFFSAAVSVIDARTGATVNRFEIPTKFGPQSFVVNSETHRLYAVDLNNNVVLVLDSLSGAVVDRVSVGDVPWGVAVDAIGNWIYVTNAQSHSLSVIDGESNRVVATVQFSGRVEAVAVDQLNGRVYVSSGTSEAVPYAYVVAATR